MPAFYFIYLSKNVKMLKNLPLYTTYDMTKKMKYIGKKRLVKIIAEVKGYGAIQELQVMRTFCSECTKKGMNLSKKWLV